MQILLDYTDYSKFLWCPFAHRQRFFAFQHFFPISFHWSSCRALLRNARPFGVFFSFLSSLCLSTSVYLYLFAGIEEQSFRHFCNFDSVRLRIFNILGIRGSLWNSDIASKGPFLGGSCTSNLHRPDRTCEQSTANHCVARHPWNTVNHAYKCDQRDRDLYSGKIFIKVDLASSWYLYNF